ncbi:hypothetical protein LEP1GSC074_2872 [Leptospira noguchii str. Hook]|uniref:Uncharacterized protein n=1 Tax=Leptospira noguchii serovar Autumnalis str. ZUN142 TaxID=1085540 RepID=M6U494_9LEPT|nr:hypothetical protein LEP1GSC041_0728 [Leptospira noguchii str. 2006001870]EMO29743.1 hypothetical protein LEP1GSC170_2829 [Leptospira interrogans serovar Bataviae str. HAI135]EMO39862.1 hypothetical protein LEP1GSC186_0731 [Leptospira noguchii serovar Autumnalis str. ZUN142]EMS83318.1 hypothetical protein LEP1GSC074_2872 [Leptospira noguchii str. Hook]
MIRFKFRRILNRNELFHKKSFFVPSKFSVQAFSEIIRIGILSKDKVFLRWFVLKKL